MATKDKISVIVDAEVESRGASVAQKGSQGAQVVTAPDSEPISVSTVSSALPAGAATEAKQDSEITQLQILNSLVPAVYDYISLSYTGDNLTGVVFKTGGSGGTTVSTLTLAYTGSNLTSVTKS